MASNGIKWHQMATNGSWWRGAVAAIGLACASSAVTAQDNPLPWDDLTEPAEYITFNVVDTDWTLYPVITANSDFVGFFGYLPDEFVIGNNVSLLWLIPDNGDGTWSMYGWSNTELKVVSDYLDNLTQTENVLADTGLDIFAGESGPLTAPKSMPFGIASDDPLAPIMEATQDPAIASALISVGAAGAPNLTEATNAQPLDECLAINTGDGFSELDIDLAYKTRVVQESMEIWLSDQMSTSLELTGLDADESYLRLCFCRPIDNTNWGPWSNWACVTGPTTNAAGCLFTGCTRNRFGKRIQISIFCNSTSTRVNELQGPRPMTVPMVAGSCPSHP